jgi:hypothetical protein
MSKAGDSVILVRAYLKPHAGGGMEVRNFRNFSAIAPGLPILGACWCPVLSMCNYDSVHNHCRTIGCPCLKMVD